jgi:hypothetical protein
MVGLGGLLVLLVPALLGGCGEGILLQGCDREGALGLRHPLLHGPLNPPCLRLAEIVEQLRERDTEEMLQCLFGHVAVTTLFTVGVEILHADARVWNPRQVRPHPVSHLHGGALHLSHRVEHVELDVRDGEHKRALAHRPLLVFLLDLFRMFVL